MRSPTRSAARLVLVPAAVHLGLATVGCGFVQNAIDTANTLGEFSDRLGKASKLTYTAGYQVTGGAPGSGPEHVTLVQQPPNTALIAGDGKLIITPELALGLVAAAALQDFSVCVTESGALASFSGTSNTGDQVAVELVSFTSKADAKAFAPPKGANVVEVTEIQP